MIKRMEALVCVLTLIISWGVYFCCAESGFLSLDCGGTGNRTDPKTGITWTPDDNYIQGGYKKNNIDPTLEFYHQSLRLFPKTLNKSCYNLPITPNLPFLLRLYFVGMVYTNKTPDFNYSIETQDMLSLREPTLQTETPQASEKILSSAGETLYICLIRKSENVDPFISSIELRPLRQGMYAPVRPGLMLHFLLRKHFGASELVRYPQDQFDRKWDLQIVKGADYVRSAEPISTNDTRDLPPPVLMQTAVSTVHRSFGFNFVPGSSEGKNLLLLYFAEIMNFSGSRILDIAINDANTSSSLRLVRNNSAIELPLMDTAIYRMTLSKASNSTMGPMLNAYEFYQTIRSSTLTSSEDVQALASVKTLLNLSNWISDPCFAHPWEGIVCTGSSVQVRVSEINLSNRNLTGSIPSSLGNMTALVKISLNNNHLTGGLPDLSKLSKLQSLDLQNNNLSGEVPAWLSQLPNLNELFIQNNNFSGVIPSKLLHTPSLKTRCDDNIYIYKQNGECQTLSSASPSSHSNRRNVGIISGVIAGAILVASLVLFVGIIINRKKSSRKEDVNSVSKGNSESIYVRGQDFSMVLVPNSTKTRSFTLDEMITATENFNHKIGKGGFGSVFFGKLEEGRQIAVKVLSSFSKQGAIEFLNEIDLLSRVHHKNLVCLLGYCNESRELMLAYEYMPGGSLKDYLYGKSGPNTSNNAKLDWKTRLKIALDAAYGLEYLHVGCTPKIIHRDVKTANILLDANLNGKLADFGLSRVTIDGEESHVTTTVKGTAGYLDPEYFSTQMLTEKSDVHSFGVVLLEIICGRKPIDGKLSEEKINLVRWVTPYVYPEVNLVKISNIVDKRLQPHDYNIKSVIHLVKLGIRCTEADPLARPTVSEVVAEIKVAMRYEKENNVGDVLDVLEFSKEYGDQMNSEVSTSELSGAKEIRSSENSSSFLG